MKFRILITISFLLLFAVTLSAQDDHNRKMPSVDDMVKRDMDSLKVNLNLTDDQIPFIQKILTDSYTKMHKLFESDTRDFSQIGKIMEDMDSNIISILTEDQSVQYRAYRERQRARFRQGNKDN